ncbi:hypothetical protein, partial [Agrobacterium sp.]|uniref:hypothetical protein n=1 Tax=Agrobacterium sp. TaxID=361 RepID=UPI0040345011
MPACPPAGLLLALLYSHRFTRLLLLLLLLLLLPLLPLLPLLLLLLLPPLGQVAVDEGASGSMSPEDVAKVQAAASSVRRGGWTWLSGG